MKLFSRSIRYELILLTKTERPLNLSVSRLVTFAAETLYRAEGQFRVLKSTLNKLSL